MDMELTWKKSTVNIMTRLIITSLENSFTLYDCVSGEQLYVKEKNNGLISDSIISDQRPKFRPFGIAFDDNDIYISSNDKIGVYDRVKYNLKRILSVKSFVNTHQILKHDDLLFITNTCNDTISIINLITNEHKFINTRKLSVTDHCIDTCDVYAHDKHHVNSITLEGDRLYFCLHNGPSGQKSRFYYYDLIKGTIHDIVEMGRSCHNIVIDGDFLYTLSTGTGNLLKYNMSDKSMEKFGIADPKEDNFLRGMDRFGDKLFIGNSNFMPFRKQENKSEVKYRKAYVYQFDMNTHEKTLFLEHNHGLIHDLKVLT